MLLVNLVVDSKNTALQHLPQAPNPAQIMAERHDVFSCDGLLPTII